MNTYASSEEISSEKKRQAARKTLYGNRSEKHDRDASGKPPLNPAGQPWGRGPEGRTTSALTSYLRRESVSVSGCPTTAGSGARQRPGGHEREAEGDARKAPPRAGLSRKRRASDAGRDADAEEKRAGQDAARRLGYHQGRDDEEKSQRAFSSRGESTDTSEEDTIIPGLGGVLMTQLTRGANDWDIMQAEALAEGGQGAKSAPDSHGGTERLVGTTEPPAVAVPREPDHVHDTAGSGAGAQSSGEAAAADALDGRRVDGESRGGVGGRRMTFTEVSLRLCPTVSKHRSAPPCIPGRTTMLMAHTRLRLSGEFTDMNRHLNMYVENMRPYFRVGP